jgi:hypothetical protein
MSIVDRLHEGLTDAVDRHWRYTKEMFDIKPEYLMTVAVADALSNGYDSVSGADVQIRLECRTRAIGYQIVTDKADLGQWFEVKKGFDGKVKRKGRADVLVSANKASHLVELKGFDPNKIQIEKEIVRIEQLFALNGGANGLVAGHIVFPSQTSCQRRLEKYGKTLLKEPSLTFKVECREHEGEDDPEDGMTRYFTNSLSIVRVPQAT